MNQPLLLPSIDGVNPVLPVTVVIVIILLALVDIILKGFAFWRAARMSKLAWFIILIIVNSAGILPLIFLLVYRREYEALKRSASAGR